MKKEIKDKVKTLYDFGLTNKEKVESYLTNAVSRTSKSKLAKLDSAADQLIRDFLNGDESYIAPLDFEDKQSKDIVVAWSKLVFYYGDKAIVTEAEAREVIGSAALKALVKEGFLHKLADKNYTMEV